MSSDCYHSSTDLLHELKSIVGDGGWKHGDDGARYFDDPRGRFKGQARFIVLPGSTNQVSQIVKRCNQEKVALIPFSGGTGVVAGQMSIESADAIVISLERMNQVREVLVDDGAMIVEAGCILEVIHHKAEEFDLTFPLSMASKGSCCIGGNLATNAGGIQVVKHGNARDLCLGIEAVLPDGSIYSDLVPLRKDNTGYDLRNLLIGSEGTLGIITAATIILKPMEPESVTAFCAVPSPAGALEIFKRLRNALGESVSAIELMSGFGVELVTSHFPDLAQPLPERFAWHLLLQVDGPLGITDRVSEVLGECLEDELVLDAVIAQSQTQQANLWDLRENTPEANRASGAFCSSDTSVPISKVQQFIERTTVVLLGIHSNLRINTYGHIGDGNIHHNVLPPLGVSKADFVADRPEIVQEVRMAINEVTHEFGGSVSAEHGIGRLKIDDLERFADSAKYMALKKIKSALDPNNIMNPGALLR